MEVKVNWSIDAVDDIERIFKRIKEKTLSENLARNVVSDIYNTGVNIQFIEQYQIDEFLGKPFRRMIVRHFKIIYRPIKEDEIRILQVFDSYQSPIKLRK